MLELTFAEMFAGIGCFRQGLEQAGWRCVWANDWHASGREWDSTKQKWKGARNLSGEIYRYHWNDGTYHDGDIREVDIRQIPDHTLLTAGFPCPSFSIAGKRKGFGEDRGTLFTHIARVAEAKRPKLLLLENVGGLLSHDSGRTFAVIVRWLGSLGYVLEWQVLNSRYFGVPQNRSRVFLVGHLGTERFEQIFPIGEDGREPAKAYAEAQGKGQRLRGDDTQVANTLSARYGKDGSENLIQVNPLQTGQYTRIYDPKGQSPTLNANTGGYHIPQIVVQKERGIPEDKMLAILGNAKKVVLLEPLYKRRYPPLGLAKIATYIKSKGGVVEFQRRYQPAGEDVTCVATLFTYESGAVFDALNNIYSANILMGREPIVLVGGVFASLMPDEILKRFPKAKVFVGYSKILDMVKPDYSIDWQVDEKWTKFSYAFSTRGCPNRCAYCAVHRLEPDMWVNPKWRDIIDTSKPNVMFSDNNLSAHPLSHMQEICDFLNQNKLQVMFDNGFDCKHITDDVTAILAKMPFLRFGMRIAFDRIAEDGMFQTAVHKLLDAGIPKEKLMAFCLFNFTDTPSEALYRLEEVNRLGLRPYPQKFTPLDALDRKKPFVGEHWTPKLLLAFRYFWLMRGEHLHKDFKTWLKEQTRFKLSPRDVSLLQDEPYQALRFVRTEEAKQMRSQSMKNGKDYTPFGEGFRELVPCEENVAGCVTDALNRDTLVGKGNLVRRLTPTECERLQGVPDGFTAKGLTADGKEIQISDSMRYKVLGNAVTVPVIAYLGEKLKRCVG